MNLEPVPGPLSWGLFRQEGDRTVRGGLLPIVNVSE